MDNNSHGELRSNVIFVFITSVTFYYAPKLKDMAKKQITQFFIKEQSNPHVASLVQQINKTEDELHRISPTAEFAAYCKKERQLIKLKDELKVYVDSQPKQDNMKERVKLELCIRLFFNFAGFLLLYLVSGIHAFCMDSSVFWPINHMLRFPSVFSAGDVCGGPESDLIPVSYFVVFYLLTVVSDKLANALFIR